MKHNLLLLIALNLFLACQNTSKQLPGQLMEKKSIARDSLKNILSSIQREGKIIGFATSIVSQNDILFAEGFGFADLENKNLYATSTVQNIASISKTFIGISLLKAQEMGILDLDDPISKHLTFDVQNPLYPKQEICIRHLATHTSSITDGSIYDEKSYILAQESSTLDTAKYFIPEEFNNPQSKMEMGEFLKALLSQDGEFYSEDLFIEKKPGSFFDYSNIGATLAAYVLEEASGISYKAFTKKYIFDPLEMTDTYWTIKSAKPGQHSHLYRDSRKLIAPYSLISYPDGGVITSIIDLSKYLRELIRGYSGEGTILSNKAYESFYEKQLDDSHFSDRDAENPFNDEYDFGVFIGFSAKGNIGHSGGDPGVSSLMFFNEETGIGKILFVNTAIMDESGFQQFIRIWETLGDFEGEF